jgi:threonyl-tRNA synthetase
MFVIGEKDRDAGSVTVRDRLEGDLGAMSLADAIAKLQEEIGAKTVRQVNPLPAATAAEQADQNEY